MQKSIEYKIAKVIKLLEGAKTEREAISANMILEKFVAKYGVDKEIIENIREMVRGKKAVTWA